MGAGDLDNDGDQDLVFTQGMNNPALIYRNDGQWRFTAVNGLPNGVGIGLGDLDDDGDLDLVLTDLDRQHVLENLGGLWFRDRSADLDLQVSHDGSSSEPATGVLTADLDLDGDLDLYFAQRTRSRVFRNDGGWRYTDVTDAWGIPARNASSTYVPAYFDASGDGVPDLFVPVDTDTVSFDLTEPAPAGEGDQLLVTQIGPRGFTGYRNEAAARGFTGTRSTMGAVIADFNGDAQPDLYLSNIGANPLFLARSDGTFTASTTHQSIALTRTNDGPCAGLVRDRTCLISSWGSALFDVDLDGDDDLVVAVSAPQLTRGDANFERQADGTWQRRSTCLRPSQSLGLVAVDLDDDGRLDLVETSHGGPAAMRRNVTTAAGHWLRVTLRGHRSNRRGIGAVVTAHRTHGSSVSRTVGAQGCAYCTGDAVAWFTAADAGPMDLEVRWPAGGRTLVPGVRPDRSVQIEEPSMP